jgi:hypothetical protein
METLKEKILKQQIHNEIDMWIGQDLMVSQIINIEDIDKHDIERLVNKILPIITREASNGN